MFLHFRLIIICDEIISGDLMKNWLCVWVVRTCVVGLDGHGTLEGETEHQVSGYVWENILSLLIFARQDIRFLIGFDNLKEMKMNMRIFPHWVTEGLLRQKHIRILMIHYEFPPLHNHKRGTKQHSPRMRWRSEHILGVDYDGAMGIATPLTRFGCAKYETEN